MDYRQADMICLEFDFDYLVVLVVWNHILAFGGFKGTYLGLKEHQNKKAMVP
jgi:hypothetical protein